MNIPNFISLSRLLIVPLIVWLILVDQMVLAFWLFVAAGVSDALDGFVAKRTGAVTRLGTFLDPVSDKVLLVSIYITLGGQGLLPLWIVILVVSRDILIVGAVLLSFTLDLQVTVKPVMVSKINTTTQIALAGVVLGQYFIGALFEPVLYGLLAIVAVTTVLSGYRYTTLWLREVAKLENAP